MIEFLNMGYASPATAAEKDGDAEFVEAMGFDFAWLDGSFPDAYGTPFNPPTPPTPDYSGIDAALDAYLLRGIRLGFVIYPNKPDTLSWSNAETPYGSLTSMRIVWGTGHMTVITQVCASMQAVIDHIRAWCVARGLDPEYWVWFQMGGREPAAGGPGGMPNSASNNGKYDKFSNSAGTTVSAAYALLQFVALFGEGYLDTDASWDALGAVVASGDAARGTEFAAIRGYHETMQYIMDTVDFYGHIVIGPSMEHQISQGWLTASRPNSLVGVSTVADRERSTFYPAGFDYYDRFDGIAIDVYAGNHSSHGGITAESYAIGFRNMANQSVRRLRQGTTRSVLLKPVYLMEVGITSPWIPSATQELRGTYWRAAFRRLREVPGVSGLGFYRGHNYQVSQDALNSGLNFGLRTSARAISAGANAVASLKGQPSLDVSLPNEPIVTGTSTE